MLHAADYLHTILNNELGYVYKLEIVLHANDYEDYHRYTEEEKDKLIAFVYANWIENNYENVTLWDLVTWTMTEFPEEFKTIDYETFCKKIDGECEKVPDLY